MTDITPQHMRFIQLGPDGGWANGSRRRTTRKVLTATMAVNCAG